MKKYMVKTRWAHPDIIELDVDRETKVSVWVNDRRRAKKNGYEEIFDTWQEA